MPRCPREGPTDSPPAPNRGESAGQLLLVFSVLFCEQVCGVAALGFMLRGKAEMTRELPPGQRPTPQEPSGSFAIAS